MTYKENVPKILLGMTEKLVCKDCQMKFNDKKRLERHIIKAHPKKRRFSNPDDYWHDPGGGI